VPEFIQVLAPREELLRAAPLSPTRTPKLPDDPLPRPKSHLCRFLTNFFPITKSSKNHYFLKPPKISKIEPEVARDLHLESFWIRRTPAGVHGV
jgi:hypothetical protein